MKKLMIASAMAMIMATGSAMAGVKQASQGGTVCWCCSCNNL